MAHFAGLVAAGLHPNPVPYAHVVTTTIHKTIGGGRGGMILCTEEFAKRIDSAVFPGQQGGPLEHVIAGKAVALRIAATEAVPRASGADRRRRARGRGRAARCRWRGQRSHRRNRRASGAVRSARVLARRQAGGGSPRIASGSRSTGTRSRSTRGRRRSQAGCGSARRRWRRAGYSWRTSSRWGRSSPRRWSPRTSSGGSRSRGADVGDRRPVSVVRAPRRAAVDLSWLQTRVASLERRDGGEDHERRHRARPPRTPSPRRRR